MPFNIPIGQSQYFGYFLLCNSLLMLLFYERFDANSWCSICALRVIQTKLLPYELSQVLFEFV